MKKVAIHVSKRARLKLTEKELELLKQYTSDADNAPYATIHKSAGIAPKTVKAIIINGSAERDTALKMRDFLNALKILENG